MPILTLSRPLALWAVPALRRLSWRPALRAAAYLPALFLIFLSYWVRRYFGTPDLEQILYHLAFGADSLLSSDPVLVRRFVRWCVLAPLLACALLAWCGRAAPLRRWRQRVLPRWLDRALGHPLWWFAGALAFWLVQVSAFDAVRANFFGDDYFRGRYVPPATVPVTARAPRNLVLIYVESLESSYRDRRVFGHNIVDPLDGLGGVQFDRYRQPPGTGWTIAAIVATQCGVPLKRVTIFDENTQGEVLGNFLPRATCLGDILHQQGYRNVFMGGGSPTFAGKGKFLRSHHYDEVYGKEDWQRQGVPASAMGGWGLHDDDLFARALVKLRTLRAAGQPFNLTLLTVDTHEPWGHLSRTCARRGERSFEGIVHCSAGEVAAFVSALRASGALEDTNVVILGDHLARKNPLADQLARVDERTIYNRFIASTMRPPARDEIVHFDLLPTLLDFIGFEVPGNRLGLGYDAFATRGPAPPPARLADMQASLMNRSAVYRQLWLADR